LYIYLQGRKKKREPTFLSLLCLHLGGGQKGGEGGKKKEIHRPPSPEKKDSCNPFSLPPTVIREERRNARMVTFEKGGKRTS